MSINLRPNLSRRDMLRLAGTGFGAIALRGLLAGDAQAAAAANTRLLNPLAPLPPHPPPPAKRCIFVYLPGGPSQIDLLDPKPRLQKENGRPLPFEKPKLQRTATGGLFASPWKFARHGESGIAV